MGSRSNLVGIKTIIDPFEVLNRSLNNLSVIYGKQSERKDLLEAREQEQKLRLDAVNENRRRYDVKEAKDLKQKTIASDFAKSYNKQWQLDRWIANNPDKFEGIKDIRAINREVLSRNALKSLTLSEDGKTIVNRFDGNIFKGDYDSPISSDFNNPAEQIERLNSLGLLDKGFYKNYTGELDKLSENTNKFLQNSIPTYQGQAKSDVTTYLIGQGLDPITSIRLGESVTQGFQNKTDLSKRAIAQQKIAYEREKTIVTAAYRVERTIGGSKWRRSYSRGPKPDYKSETDVAKYIDDTFNDKSDYFDDLHPWEDGKLMSYWKAATNSNLGDNVVDRNVAMIALGDFVEEGLFWGKDVKGNVKDFVTFAQSISKFKSKNSLSRSELMDTYTPKEVPFRDAVEQNWKAFQYDLGRLGPQPNYRIPNKRVKLTDNTGSITTVVLNPNKVEEIPESNTGVITTGDVITTEALTPTSTDDLNSFKTKTESKTDLELLYEKNDRLTALVKKTNGDDYLGDSGTMLIINKTRDGKSRSWKEITNEIDNHNLIKGFFNGITPEEYRAGEQNESARSSIIAKYNRIIMNSLKGDVTGDSIISGAGNSLGRLWDSFTDRLSLGPTPGTPEFDTETKQMALDERAAYDLAENRKILQMRVDKYLGTKDPSSSLGGAYATSINEYYSDVDGLQTALDVGVGVGTAAAAIYTGPIVGTGLGIARVSAGFVGSLISKIPFSKVKQILTNLSKWKKTKVTPRYARPTNKSPLGPPTQSQFEAAQVAFSRREAFAEASKNISRGVLKPRNSGSGSRFSSKNGTWGNVFRGN